MEKIYIIKRIKNDVNGNPRYEIPSTMISEFPKLKKLGRKKRNSNARIVMSYNIKEEICENINKNIKISIEF